MNKVFIISPSPKTKITSWFSDKRQVEYLLYSLEMGLITCLLGEAKSTKASHKVSPNWDQHWKTFSKT